MITSLIDTSVIAAPIQAFPTQLPTVQDIVSPAVDSPDSPFTAFFNAAMNVVADTNNMQHAATDMQFAFATGRTDDILAVQLAQDRAMNSLNFTVQITNRVIEAYREIMRMQI